MDDIVLGQVDGKQGPVLQKFSALFAGIQLKVAIPENIMHYIWVQYAINAGLWTGLVRMMFKFNQSVQRASAHGLVELVEIKGAFDGLLKTGDELGVAMPVTKSFQAVMERFAWEGKS